MVDDDMLYLKNDKGFAPNSCSSALNGLRFFYKHVGEKDFSFSYSIPKRSRRLPTVLTMEDIWNEAKRRSGVKDTASNAV